MNIEKTRFVKEKIINIDALTFSFDVEVIDGAGLPLATGTNIASYKLEKLNDNSCMVTIKVLMRSDPAIFSALFKGKYQDWMENYLIGVHHHVLTGEIVTSMNFKEIHKQYE